jgi:hypothetical protein
MKNKVVFLLMILAFAFVATPVFAQSFKEKAKTKSSSNKQIVAKSNCDRVNKSISKAVSKYNVTQQYEKQYNNLKNSDRSQDLTKQVEKTKKLQKSYVEALKSVQNQSCAAENKTAYVQYLKKAHEIYKQYLQEAKTVNTLLGKVQH